MAIEGETPAAKGGKARAEALTPERRSEIARMGAQARSNQFDDTLKDGLPEATHRGSLKISDDLVLPCAVLSDGTRVIAENAVARQLGRGLGGKTQRLAARANEGVPLPAYLAPILEPFVPESLRIALTHPVIYRDRGGVRRAVPAALLPEICEVWQKASEAGALQKSQEPIARKALALTRALSRVGVIALVDEATEYQAVRDRDELHRILAAYVNEELLPWTKRFPDEFYEQLFRLRGWDYDPPSVKRPKLVGKLTDQLVYEKLPPGVLQELKARNPVDSRGRRKNKHHQLLTSEVGHPHLAQHLASVTTLMRVSVTWSQFKRLFDRAFSRYEQAPLPGMEEDDEAIA